MRAAVVIPARYASSRFPGKPLIELLGKPMIAWVAERAAAAVGVDSVFIATDDSRIAECANRFGFRSIMTSSNALTGTDRVAEAAESIEAEIFVNVQGDEPLIEPADILAAIAQKESDPSVIVNGFAWISADEDARSVNLPKVVVSESGRLLYISRSLIPGIKQVPAGPVMYRKQVCVYAFSKTELRRFRSLGRKSANEAYEDIEIVRFLDLDFPVQMIETQPGSVAIDVPEDVDSALRIMRMRGL
jgi:3-deoxy-manno-octulosonate cytidylyltransferase (CMP-KDO synthetase)